MFTTLRWAIVSPLCVAASMSMVAYSGSVECRTNLASRWVHEHHGQLPKTMPELAKFSAAYRNVILTHLDASTRATLWREHFAPYLTPTGGLTVPQRSLLREVYEATPRLMTLDRRDLLAEAAKPGGLEERARSMFSDSLYREIFMNVAPPASDIPARWTEAGLAGGIEAIVAAAGKVIIGRRGFDVCNCASSGDCYGGERCTWFDPPHCNGGSCGILTSCDGECI